MDEGRAEGDRGEESGTQRFSPVYSFVRRRLARVEIVIRLPATPSCRISRACRICRHGVCWSTVSGNPSSSDLVTGSSLANRHHSAFERLRLRWRASPERVRHAGNAGHTIIPPENQPPYARPKTLAIARRRSVRIPAT